MLAQHGTLLKPSMSTRNNGPHLSFSNPKRLSSDRYSISRRHHARATLAEEVDVIDSMVSNLGYESRRSLASLFSTEEVCPLLVNLSYEVKVDEAGDAYDIGSSFDVDEFNKYIASRRTYLPRRRCAAAMAALSNGMGYREHSVAVVGDVDFERKVYTIGVFDAMQHEDSNGILFEAMKDMTIPGFRVEVVDLGALCPKRRCAQYHLDASICHLFTLWFLATWCDMGSPPPTDERAMRGVVEAAMRDANGDPLTRTVTLPGLAYQLKMLMLMRTVTNAYLEDPSTEPRNAAWVRKETQGDEALEGRLVRLGFPPFDSRFRFARRRTSDNGSGRRTATMGVTTTRRSSR
jgi:hypothetical protein